MSKFTYEEVVQAVEQVVAEKPSYYSYDPEDGEHPESSRPRYRYTNIDGTGSCIVGCFLAVKMPDTFAEIHAIEFATNRPRSLVGAIRGLLEGRWVRTTNGQPNGVTARPDHELTMSFDGRTKEFLRVLQVQQDEGATWYVALEQAKLAAEAWR